MCNIFSPLMEYGKVKDQGPFLESPVNSLGAQTHFEIQRVMTRH